MTEELLKERKEAMLALINDPTYVPMKIKELAMLLDVPREKRDELKEVLDALVADGKVGLSKRGKYGKPEAFTLVGTFCGHAKGFGFVTVEGMDQDVRLRRPKTLCTGTPCRLRRVRLPRENARRVPLSG